MTTASTNGVKITYSPVRNAEVDGVVYCKPTVWAAYPPKSSSPAITPTRTSNRRSSPRRRATSTAKGASTITAMLNRSTRYANGVTSSSASCTSGNVTPKRKAAATRAPSAANRRWPMPAPSPASGW